MPYIPISHPLDNLPEKMEQRRELRTHGTPAEGAMWRILRNRQVHGLRFRRQYSVGPYILDFYCPELRLDIEMDGASHFQYDGAEHDAERTRYLQCEHGIEVWRYENSQIFAQPQGNFVEALKLRLKEKKEAKEKES